MIKPNNTTPYCDIKVGYSDFIIPYPDYIVQYPTILLPYRDLNWPYPDNIILILSVRGSSLYVRI